MSNEATLSRTVLVAANIRAEIARQRVSQRALADALGMSPAALSNRLTGMTPIDVNELGAIADVLRVTAASLLADAVSAA
jgi:transcriptional regulator with XRE-family HTH domain